MRVRALGVGAVREQHLDRRCVVARGGVMERRVVVDPALLDVGAELEQQREQRGDVVARRVDRGEQRREAAEVFVVGIGARLEQRANELERRQRDRVRQNGRVQVRVARVGEVGRVAEREARGFEVAGSQRLLEAQVRALAIRSSEAAPQRRRDALLAVQHGLAAQASARSRSAPNEIDAPAGDENAMRHA